MKTILFSSVLLGFLFMTSCEKQESTPIINELESKSIKFKDTILDEGSQVTYDFKVDIDIDRETGGITAKLITPMPKYGWNIEYSLFQGKTPVSNHTYKRIKQNEVTFKVMAFPERKDGKEYTLEIISNSYGSRSRDQENKLILKFKNN